MLAVGGLPAVIPEGHNDEETEKRIASAILQGCPALLLDNLQRTLASTTLESILTDPIARIRKFGSLSDDVITECRALVLMTANNASLRRDLLRRTLPVRLVVPHENPERRRFDFDPVDEARRDRGKLLAAAFTIAKAWHLVRSLPEHAAIRDKTLGSFEVWADLVAGSVEWLTGTNPIDVIEDRKDSDAAAIAERGMIAQLAQAFPNGERFTAAEAATRKHGAACSTSRARNRTAGRSELGCAAAKIAASASRTTTASRQSPPSKMWTQTARASRSGKSTPDIRHPKAKGFCGIQKIVPYVPGQFHPQAGKLAVQQSAALTLYGGRPNTYGNTRHIRHPPRRRHPRNRSDLMDVLERTRAAGIKLSVSGGQLAYSAPPGAMTPDLLAEIRAHKPQLMERLAVPTDLRADVLAYVANTSRGPCTRCGQPVTRLGVTHGFRNGFGDLVHLRCPASQRETQALSRA